MMLEPESIILNCSNLNTQIYTKCYSLPFYAEHIIPVPQKPQLISLMDIVLYMLCHLEDSTHVFMLIPYCHVLLSSLLRPFSRFFWLHMLWLIWIWKIFHCHGEHFFQWEGVCVTFNSLVNFTCKITLNILRCSSYLIT